MDNYLNDHLKSAVETTPTVANNSAESETMPKKSGGGTGSFIVGFLFGLVGVLVSFCWGGARAAVRGCLWRLACVIIGTLILMLLSQLSMR